MQAAQWVDPCVEGLIVTSSRFTELARRHSVGTVTIPANFREPVADGAPDHRRLSSSETAKMIEGIALAWRPRLLVLDTHPPAGLVDAALRQGIEPVLVLRKVRRAVAERLLTSEDLSGLSAILLPHARSELLFGADRDFWASALTDPRLRCVGPVVREDPATIESEGGGPVVLVTSGGGGYAQEASSLFRTVLRGARVLRRDRPALELRVVVGPYARPPTDVPDWVRVLERPLDVLAHLKAADLVVAHAGYNSVHEALRARRPLILMPGQRAAEDQAERAAWAATLGAPTLQPSMRDDEVAALLHRTMEAPPPQTPEGERSLGRELLAVLGRCDLAQLTPTDRTVTTLYGREGASATERWLSIRGDVPRARLESEVASGPRLRGVRVDGRAAEIAGVLWALDGAIGGDRPERIVVTVDGEWTGELGDALGVARGCRLELVVSERCLDAIERIDQCAERAGVDRHEIVVCPSDGWRERAAATVGRLDHSRRRRGFAPIRVRR